MVSSEVAALSVVISFRSLEQLLQTKVILLNIFLVVEEIIVVGIWGLLLRVDHRLEKRGSENVSLHIHSDDLIWFGFIILICY